jgi:transcriptional regulator with XRE-family HTH domain
MGKILQIEYLGKVYTGEQKELIFRLRQELKLSQTKIAYLVGLSRERVSQILERDGRLFRPELNDPETFRHDTDEVVSYKLGVSISRVRVARRKLGIRKYVAPPKERRIKNLALFLFNKCPGPNFSSFVSKQISKLPELKAEMLMKYYLFGLDVKLGKSLSYDRFFRWYSKNKLKKSIKSFNVKELEEQGIIKDCEEKKEDE